MPGPVPEPRLRQKRGLKLENLFRVPPTKAEGATNSRVKRGCHLLSFRYAD